MRRERRIVEGRSQERQDLERAGWPLVARSWGAQLDAANCDVRRLQSLVTRAEAVGRARALRQGDVASVLALDAATIEDYPGDEATAHAALTPAGATVAARRHGYGVVERDGGLAAVTFVDLDQRRAEVDFTTVAPMRRRLGLATAAKALSILELLDQGIEHFRTGGSLDNSAILAANKACGYVIDETWLTFMSPGDDAVH